MTLRHSIRTIFPLFFVAIVLLPLIFGACSTKQTTEPTTDGSYLIITPDTIVLQKSDTTKTSEFKLSCGCGFTLEVTSVTVGDTKTMGEWIQYLSIEPTSDVLSSHSFRVFFEPNKVPSGKFTFLIHFTAVKTRYTYSGSVYVTINN